MKKINILFLTSLMALSSCESVLDKDPKDAFTDGNFWTSENNVSGYANAFYENFTGYGNGNGTGLFYFKTLSDDQAGNSFTDWTYLNVPATDSNWKGCWEEIRRACIMMEKIPTISTMDEATKNHWIGVARMMRAWEYYQLVRMYGNVPWTDKSLTITDDGVLYASREKRDVVMDKVLEDINFACNNMIAGKGSKVTFSVDMANAMKAEICLYEGTFRKYRTVADKQDAPDLAGAKKFLAEAKAACKVIMGKGYTLNASYQGNYNATDLSGNKEMILYKAYKQSLLTHSLVDYTCSSTQISGMTKDAFEAYLYKDGKPLGVTSENTSDLPVEVKEKQVLDKGKPTQRDTIIYRYSIKELLKLRDGRLAQTIDTCVFYNGRGFTRFNVGMESTSSTGYGVSKYDNAAIPVNFRNQSSSNYTHCPLFWLSVVYLQYAEASAELADLGGEAISQTDLDNSINLLRKRAGVLPNLSVNPGFSDPKNTIGISDLLWEIRRERRCELMFDNWNRYWDLIRWHQLDKLDSTNNPDILLGANVSADKNIAQNKKVEVVGKYLDGSKGKKRAFDVKYYLYPIPSGQIALNPNLAPNNPGW